jgi:hypothetical protein
MATGIAAIVVAAGALLGGCQVAMPGAAGVSAADQQKADKRAERDAAVEGALAALENQPVAVYHSTLNGTDLVLRITKGGTMLGSLPIGGQAVQVVDVDNQLYISASADFWKAHGSTAAGTHAKGWTRADATDLALDPGSVLTPIGASRKIRASLSTMDQLADPVRTKLADGTEVFEVGSGVGRLKVTTAQPYRVVSFAPALLEAAIGQTFGSEFRLDPVTPGTVNTFHEDLDAAVGALGRPADSVAQASVRIINNKLDCNSSTGSCTSSVQVDNSLVGGDTKSTVHLVMTSVVTADSLGTQTCTGEASAAPNTSSTLVCTVKFNLPNRTAQYKVVSIPSAIGDVLASVDVNAVKQKIQSEFAAIGG